MSRELEMARRLLYRGWTQGSNARNEYLTCVAPADHRACCWCITGALMAVDADVHRGVRKLGFRDAFEAMRWNDAPGRTQEEVLARFDGLCNEGVMQNAA